MGVIVQWMTTGECVLRGETHFNLRKQETKFLEKIESDWASSFIMNAGFQAAEEKGMEGTQYSESPGDEKTTAVMG